MSAADRSRPERWADALLAARLVALDPGGLKGIRVRAGAGPVRARFLDALLALAGDGVPVRRAAAGIQPGRLAGGLDLGATIEAGRPVMERGVLAAADGGFVILAMAERAAAPAAGLIAAALDEGLVRIEREGLSATISTRFALVALDEGEAEEGLHPALADRLALTVDLHPVPLGEARVAEFDPATLVEARRLLPDVEISRAMMEALCALAGAGSMRVPLHLLRAARAHAALEGRGAVEAEDAAAAVRLVLGAGSAAEAGEAEDAQPPPAEPPADSEGDPGPASEACAGDILLDAVKAHLPKNLLDALLSGAARTRSRAPEGKAGALRDRGARGRAAGDLDRPPFPAARPDILSTMRAAVPWQRLRGRPPGARLLVRKQDFRYRRIAQRTGTTAIFVVDASGSAARERLAETKGAVELLLAECYVRRDHVALVAFRGTAAEVLLEPTRSLLRAKRMLAALPGGGGTPLAAGVTAALSLALSARRRGQTVLPVFLTDGRGNVALDGAGGRGRAREDAMAAARAFRAQDFRAILIDTARRPQAPARELAEALGAEFLALPFGGSEALARQVGARMTG